MAKKVEKKVSAPVLTGRRKSSVARVSIDPVGKGNVVVNGKSLEEYFGLGTLQFIVKQPLVLLGLDGKVDVRVNVVGGGLTGQAGAIRQAIARALVESNETYKAELKKAGFLTRDAREKERKKPGFKKARKSAQYVLNKVLCESLKLLHPVMPFVTEEIYTKLYNDDDSIMISEWPKYQEKYNFEKDEDEIEKFKAIITEIRNIRNNMNVHPSRKSKLIVVTQNYKDLIAESEELLKKLGFADSIELKANKEGIPTNAVSVVTDGIEVFMPFEDLVDIAAEKERLEGEKTKLEAEVARAEKMLSNPGFVNKAPEAKINEEKAKLAKYKEMLDSVMERLKNM